MNWVLNGVDGGGKGRLRLRHAQPFTPRVLKGRGSQTTNFKLSYVACLSSYFLNEDVFQSRQ